MKLTPSKALNLAKKYGMSYGVKILPDSPLFNNSTNLANFANAIYALGIAEGKAVGAAEMRERCDKEIESLLDAAEFWSGYVVEDTAPHTLLKELNKALESVRALKEMP